MKPIVTAHLYAIILKFLGRRVFCGNFLLLSALKAFSMGSTTIRDVAKHLEFIAPQAYQESYDNAGLLTGNPADALKGILVTLDCTEAVVEEAVETGCNLIVAHHPIIFRGLKRLTGSNYVERTVIKAIRNDIAIYAIHTNLDNVHNGVNRKICEKIGLTNVSVLVPPQDCGRGKSGGCG